MAPFGALAAAFCEKRHTEPLSADCSRHLAGVTELVLPLWLSVEVDVGRSESSVKEIELPKTQPLPGLVCTRLDVSSPPSLVFTSVCIYESLLYS